MNKEITHIILDTNVLLHDPRAIFQFPNQTIVIPIEVIEEIEKFKRDAGELGSNSRKLTTILDSIREKGDPGKGLELPDNSFLIIDYDPSVNSTGKNTQNATDKRILHIAEKLKKQGYSVKIISQNINLRLKANICKIPADNLLVDRIIDSREITGWRSIKIQESSMNSLLETHKLQLKNFTGYTNEFIHLNCDSPNNKEAIAIVKENNTLHLLPKLPSHITGISPLSIEQELALHALMDDSINLVTLVGKAGTGKTLIAIAAALHKMYVENIYNKVLIFRPTMPVSRDMGFLPGDLNDKMGPWMQPIFDAVDLLKILDKSSPRRSLPPDIMESGDITIEPLTYIRGRSIPNQFIIIDEAQNLTPLEVKTVITRVGKNSKIILTGDPHQIDNPYLDSLSNGLSILVNKFLGHPLYAHIGLVKGERSLLSEAAANLL